MKTKDIKVGQVLVWCRQSNGPRMPRSYGSAPSYTEVRVIDPAWPGKWVPQHSTPNRDKVYGDLLAIRNVQAKGILVEYERRPVRRVLGGVDAPMETGREVLPARQLYADDVAALDAYWDDWRTKRNADIERREAEADAARAREIHAMKRMAAIIGLEPSKTGGALRHLTIDQFERLLDAAEKTEA